MMDYSNLISQRVQQIKPSGIRKFFDILETMDDVISLGVGEPDFQTPWHIRDAGIYSLEKGFTKYTSNAGLSNLRKEISRYLARRFDLQYEADQILVTVGGSEAIDLAMRCLLNPGDEVIIPEPSFVCYGPIASLCSGVPVPLKLSAENEFRVTPEQIQAVLTPRTKAIVLPYPSNPTGGIMERSDLEAIAPVLKEHQIFVISDEIYAELTYGGLRHTSMANLPDLYDQTIVVNGMSKAYSMTGWRLGYVCGPEPLVSQMTKIHQFAIMSAPTTSQYAAIEAVSNGDADIEAMKEEYDGRRRFLVNGLNDLGLKTFEPKGAFYAFPCIRSTGLSSEDFCEQLLLREKVAVIAGNAFGDSGEGYVRMCYAASIQDLEESLNRIEHFLKSLK